MTRRGRDAREGKRGKGGEELTPQWGSAAGRGSGKALGSLLQLQLLVPAVLWDEAAVWLGGHEYYVHRLTWHPFPSHHPSASHKLGPHSGQARRQVGGQAGGQAGGQ